MPGAEISKNTKVVIGVGSIAAIVIAILTAGHWWGTLDSQRESNAQTLIRHETEISELQRNFADLKLNVQAIQNEQQNARDTLNKVDRQTVAILSDLGNVKVALAGKGLHVTSD